MSSDSSGGAILIDLFVRKVHKIEASPQEYEDRFCAWGFDTFKARTAPCRAAVSDGASDSIHSGLWANLLVHAYCDPEQGGGETLLERLPQLQAAWRDAATAQPLPWYAEAKLAQGASATLLGITLRQAAAEADSDSGRWEALAIGDSCVFQVRDNALSCAFPLTRSDDFASRPVLLSTRRLPSADALTPYLMREEGTWRAGDEFYLMTDALAAWFLREVEAGREPWQWLRSLGTKREPMPFAALVDDLRGRGRLRDDDTTLLRLRIAQRSPASDA